MTEEQLLPLVKAFLKNKGYLDRNLHMPINMPDSGADIIIKDSTNEFEALAIIQLRLSENDDKLNEKIKQIRRPKISSNRISDGLINVPIYIFRYSDDSEDKLKIYELLQNGGLQIIINSFFPTYDELIINNYKNESNDADRIKSISERELELKKAALEREMKLLNLYRSKSKEENYRTYKYIAVVTAIITVFALIVTFYLSKKAESLDVSYKVDNRIKLDSLKTVNYNLKKEYLDILAKNPNKSDTVLRIAQKYIDIEKRINGLEKTFLDNPDRALTILKIDNEIESLKKDDQFLKELYQAKIESIEKRIDFIINIAITVVIGVLSFVILSALRWFVFNKKDLDI